MQIIQVFRNDSTYSLSWRSLPLMWGRIFLKKKSFPIVQYVAVAFFSTWNVSLKYQISIL